MLRLASDDRIPRIGRMAVCWALLLVVLFGIPAPARAEPSGDAVELACGHADIGVVHDDGSWVVRIKDDTGGEPVWRDPGQTLLRVSDAAEHTVPDDDQYSFLGEPGQHVHLIPQTQADGVLWLGWNTQHPTVLDDPPRSIRVNVHTSAGPGAVHVYLDYGGFRPAEELWGPENPDARIDVPVDTHAHANWAFTAPGEYVVEFSADIVDSQGEAQRATGELHFLVGDDAQPAALPSSGQPGMPAWAAVIGALLVIGMGALAVVLLLRRRRRRRP